MEPAPAPATASPDPTPRYPAPLPTKRSAWKQPSPSSTANGAPHADTPPPPAVMDADHWPTLAAAAKTKTLLPATSESPKPPPDPRPPAAASSVRSPFPLPLLPSLSCRWCSPAVHNFPAAVADGLSSDQKWRSCSGRRQRTRLAGDVPHATAPTSSWSILVVVGVPRRLPSMLMRPWWQQLQERGKRSCSLFIHLELQVAPLRHLELHRDEDTHRGDLVRSLVIIWSITELCIHH
ncbi:hypothetical protein ZWY2020_033333 [Hordeum vulgare]|nr:hypothetical protein ZWY2020_033333 [Hordeum vulgare]